MTHLTPDELIDTIEGTLPSGRRAHLAACDDCRREVAQLGALMTEVTEIEVPDPSPLFWGHLSARVRAAIADDGAPPRAFRWFEWPVLAPVSALALIIVALVFAVPESPADRSQGQFAATDILRNGNRAGDPDAQWAVLAEMVGELDVETARQAGIATGPGTADEAVWQLTSAEQQELLRLLREELGAGGS